MKRWLNVLVALALLLGAGLVGSSAVTGDAAAAEVATSFAYPIPGTTAGKAFGLKNPDLRPPTCTDSRPLAQGGCWSPTYNDWVGNLRHTGEDWFASSGDEVKAIASGRVVAVGSWSPGWYVIVQHDLPPGTLTPWGTSTLYSLYAHLNDAGRPALGSDVVKGTTKVGTVLGQGANSHLHLELRRYRSMGDAPSHPKYKHNGTVPGTGYAASDASDADMGAIGYTSPSVWIASHSGSTSPSDIALASGQTLGNQSVASSQWRYYSINVPSGSSRLEVRTTAGSGDADLYLRHGSKPSTSSSACASAGGTSTEACSIANPTAGTWWVGIYGFPGATATYSIVATVSGASGPPPAPGDVALTSGQTLSNQSVASSQWRYYSINVPSGSSRLEVRTTAGSGDADLYLRHGSKPSTSSSACASAGGTSTEACSIANPTAGTWWVGIYGFPGATATYSIVATVTGTSGPPPAPGDVALTSGQTLSNQSVASSQWRYYSINVPSGSSRLEVRTTAGSGDADLYLRQGSKPSTSSSACVSAGGTSTEACSITNPASGTWWVGIYGFPGATATYSIVVTVTAQGTACSDAASLDSQSTYPTIAPGQSTHIVIRVKNSGTCTWSGAAGYGYRSTDQWSSQYGSGQLWRTVAPNEVITFEATVTPPSTPQTYTYGFLLTKNGQTFGPYFYIRVTVAAATTRTEVIVDDTSGGFVRGGTASYWQQANIGFNAHMWWTYVRSSGVDNWGKWTPNLNGSGNYEVYVFVPRDNATTTYAGYRIRHNGRDDGVRINQDIRYDEWVSLGTYYFNDASDEYVFMGDETFETSGSKKIGFDAMKFVPR